MKLLDKLAKNQHLILLAEIGVLVHDLGKLSKEFVTYQAEDSQQSFEHTLILKRSQVPDDFLPDTLRQRLDDVHLVFPAPLEEEIRLGDYIESHHDTSSAAAYEATKLLAPKFDGCDGLDSGMDKGSVSDEAKQQLGQTFIATAFGHEAQPVPEDQLKRIRHEFAAALAEALDSVRGGRAEWTDVHQQVFREAEKAFRQALGETRRAANDVTLWDHSYSVASLYKAALAGILLEDKWPEKGVKGKKNKEKLLLRWRVMRVSFDGQAFWGQANGVPDLLGRRQALEEARDAVRRKLEVDYPLGNEIYRDENGSIFLMPGLKDAGAEHGTLAEEIQGVVSAVFSDPDGVGGELTPRVEWNGEGPVPGLNGQEGQPDLIKAFGGLIAQEPPRPVADLQALNGWWRKTQTEGEEREICTVCGLRPVGYSPRSGATRSSDAEKARRRHICGVCLDRRGRRAEEWATSGLQETIWTDEVADNNGRFALVVGRFGLNEWLDGVLVRTMWVKADNADVVPKHPSPARIRRCWETTQRFWQEVRDGVIPDAVGRVGGRLELKVENPQQATKELGHYPTVYDWPLGGGVTLSVVWLPDRRAFISADNLAYLAGPEQLRLLKREELRDEARVTREIREAIESQREVDLLEPSDYGRPAETRIRVRLSEVTDYPDSSYVPHIPILAEPALFMALVPADRALDAARRIKEKYEREMGRVRDRLPLYLGLVFAPRMTPLRAVLEAGRALLQMPTSAPWEKWKVEGRKDRSLTLDANGRTVKWEYPKMMGDGSTPDLWYANLLKIEPEGYPTRFARVKFEGDGLGRWIAETADSQTSTLTVNNIEALNEGDEVLVSPSRFDFVFLDSTARRYELHYGSDGRLSGRPTHPFYLEDLDRLGRLWELLQRLETTQVHAVVGAIEEKRRDWEVDLRPAAEKDDTFTQFVRDTLARANWPKDRQWSDKAAWRGKDGADERDLLVAAAVRGELADVVELRMNILKERPGRERPEGKEAD